MYQADTTVQKLQEVSNNLATAKQISVQKVFLPSNVQSDIDNVESKLNSSASTVADETAKNSHDIRDLLDSVWVYEYDSNLNSFVWNCYTKEYTGVLPGD